VVLGLRRRVDDSWGRIEARPVPETEFELGFLSKLGSMARRKPTQERAEVTVQAILDATALILVDEGYAKVSTNRIARRAGVSIGSLYHYFADKDAITEALLERVVERQMVELAGALEELVELDREQGVRALIRAAMASQKVEAKLAHALMQCPMEGRASLHRRWQDRVTELVSMQLMVGSDPVRPRNVNLAAYVLVHAVFGVVRDALADRPELLRGDALTEELTELVLRYLRPEERLVY
jgi:AcrR family transcriptional regulator